MRSGLGALGLGLLGACAPVTPGDVPARQVAAVVDGTAAPADDAVVALLARRVRCTGEPLTLLCSGALVAPDVVLTAAHCLEVFGPGGAYEVFLGERLPEDSGAQGRFVRVARAVRHPAYVPATHAWDVALLRLASPVDVPPLALAAPEDEGLMPGGLARVVGFGATKDPTLAGGTRRQGDLRVTQVDAASFRAGPAPAMSCVGDSGGPVLARDARGQEVLVGITVSGDFACQREAVQVRVAALREGFLAPFLAEPPAPAGPVLAPGGLCAAPCTRDAECPSGLSCEGSEAGAPGQCLLHALQAGDYGARCTGDDTCGEAGPCVRLEPEGPEACRCFTACAPPPGDDAPRGCAASAGLVPWAMAAGAWRGGRRRTGPWARLTGRCRV
ncbi:S1 family peptidase [Melittangium boletus]|uniref:S1 family peptidase n=1 Tax=Melittangium boletus TaxID=83453 RepID=UPI003DA554EC